MTDVASFVDGFVGGNRDLIKSAITRYETVPLSAARLKITTDPKELPTFDDPAQVWLSNDSFRGLRLWYRFKGKYATADLGDAAVAIARVKGAAGNAISVQVIVPEDDGAQLTVTVVDQAVIIQTATSTVAMIASVSDGNITWTALTPGSDGDNIQIIYADLGSDAVDETTVVLDGDIVRITLAQTAGGSGNGHVICALGDNADVSWEVESLSGDTGNGYQITYQYNSGYPAHNITFGGSGLVSIAFFGPDSTAQDLMDAFNENQDAIQSFFSLSLAAGNDGTGLLREGTWTLQNGSGARNAIAPTDLGSDADLEWENNYQRFDTGNGATMTYTADGGLDPHEVVADSGMAYPTVGIRFGSDSTAQDVLDYYRSNSSFSIRPASVEGQDASGALSEGTWTFADGRAAGSASITATVQDVLDAVAGNPDVNALVSAASDSPGNAPPFDSIFNFSGGSDAGTDASTAGQIRDAVKAHPAANALIAIAATDGDNQIVSNQDATYLTDGDDQIHTGSSWSD